MKLFIIPLVLFAFPSLSFGLKCLTCHATTADWARCTDNQTPVERECDGIQPGDEAVVCRLQEHVEWGNRKLHALGCESITRIYSFSRCSGLSSTKFIAPDQPLLHELFMICRCGTDSCNTYANSIQCHSCVGNLTTSGGADTRTDYACKKGEIPFEEERCPFNEQAGCQIRWNNRENAILGCHNGYSRDYPKFFMETVECYGNKDSGGCYCSTNLCNTDSLKELYLKEQAETTTTTDSQHKHSGLSGGGNTGKKNSSLSSTSIIGLIVGIVVLIVIVIVSVIVFIIWKRRR